MGNNISILIIDDAKDTLIILEKALTKQGFKTYTSEKVIEAIDIIKKNNIDIVISDINMPEISGLDFLFWIQENSPKIKVILITSLPFEEIQDFVTKNSIIYFEKPVKPKELINYINENLLNKNFYGDIRVIGIIDLLKILIISGKNRLLQVEKDNNKGKIYIKEGKIIHSEFNNISGEIAFFNIIKIKNGVFKELKWKEPSITTIDKQFTYLLNEANKIIQNLENINNKILVVDDDKMTVLIIEKYLKEKDFSVTGINSAIEGIELLKKEHFGFIILDINMPEISGLEFLIWIREYSPQSKVIIITSLDSDTLKSFALGEKTIGFFNKPVSLKELEVFIKNKQETNNNFEGSILDINLIQFIEINIISNNSSVIKIFNPLKNKKGEIFIEKGKIVHAIIDDKEGEDAFYEIIKLKSGLFTDYNWYPPEKYTISLPTQLLIKKSNEIGNKIDLEVKDLVKSRSKIVQKALNKKKDLEEFLLEENSLKKLTIYISGVALGIVIGRTTKFEAIEQLKKFSKLDLEPQIMNKVIMADDITVTVLFNDKNIVEEMVFGKFYRGSTKEGVKIADTLEKAIIIYGKPKLCTIRGAVWDNIAFFSNDNKTISSIKIKNADYFN